VVAKYGPFVTTNKARSRQLPSLYRFDQTQVERQFGSKLFRVCTFGPFVRAFEGLERQRTSVRQTRIDHLVRDRDVVLVTGETATGECRTPPKRSREVS